MTAQGRELAVSALEKQQWRLPVGGVEMEDLSVDGVVIPDFVDVADLAIDPGHRALDDRRSVSTLRHRDSREFVAPFGRKAATDVFLLSAEDIDAESSNALDPRPTRG